MYASIKLNTFKPREKKRGHFYEGDIKYGTLCWVWSNLVTHPKAHGQPFYEGAKRDAVCKCECLDTLHVCVSY